MQLASTILFWAGILLLVDGSIGLLFEERWRRMAGNLDIRRLALVEIGLAFALLGMHGLIALNPD